METNKLGFLCLFFVFFNPFPVLGSRIHLQKPLDEQATLKTYIVHVRKPDSAIFASSDDRATWYRSFLPVRTADAEEPRMVYSYNSVVSGFAARLSEEEVEAMQDKEGFLSARPDRVIKTQTTRSPDFMGLVRGGGFWPNSGFGKGVVVGLLDTGILPSHPSFADDGMPAPPAKWKGVCEFNSSDCNNKLIGLRGFNSGAAAMGLAVGGSGGAGVAAVPSPYDEEGHGTHTASTATGRFIAGADVLGKANGTAVGMAPLAHVAMYKVCYGEGCAESDILAGMDAAVEDGVDVLSLSLGGPPADFYNDNIAIGAFGATEKGVFVSCAAGNSGPTPMSLSNEAPWILTVGASSIDRTIRATIKLGNGAQYHGESLFQPSDVHGPALRKVVYPGAGGNATLATCEDIELGGQNVKGKIVLCDRGGNIGRIAKGSVVKAAGGAGMILANTEVDGFSTIADPHVLPASQVSFVDCQKIKAYLNGSSKPTAGLVFEGTMLGTSPAPVVASFSSRGPSFADPNILKPDIIGPGLSILAAWPFPVGPNTTAVSDSPARFNIISGTSMSCPHLSGIAALLKAAHPEWSPAAIKSAIMTTAHVTEPDGKSPILDQNHNPADLFAVGAGHVGPVRATDPGLVYDIEPADYIKYLCGLGYTNVQVSTVARQNVRCSNYGSILAGDLNYPSFSVMMTKAPVTFKRTATNVDAGKSVYDVVVVTPKGVKVDVEPKRLEFSGVGESKSYSVTFSMAVNGSAPATSFAAGYLKWVSTGKYGGSNGTETAKPCVKGCGFIGSPDTMDMCSVCFRTFLTKKEQDAATKAAMKSEDAADIASEAAAVPSVKKRCAACRKPVGLTGFECRCGSVFCGAHRYREEHGCKVDYKAEGQSDIAKANLVVKADKLVSKL